jgi:hypothetical protein
MISQRFLFTFNKLLDQLNNRIKERNIANELSNKTKDPKYSTIRNCLDNCQFMLPYSLTDLISCNKNRNLSEKYKLCENRIDMIGGHLNNYLSNLMNGGKLNEQQIFQINRLD